MTFKETRTIPISSEQLLRGTTPTRRRYVFRIIDVESLFKGGKHSLSITYCIDDDDEHAGWMVKQCYPTADHTERLRSMLMATGSLDQGFRELDPHTLIGRRLVATLAFEADARDGHDHPLLEDLARVHDGE